MDREVQHAAPYEEGLALVVWADTVGESWVSGCADEQRVDLSALTTRRLFSWLYVTMCRDAAGGVGWHDVRKAIGDALSSIAGDVLRQRGRTSERYDPETWGTSPEQQADMMALMQAADRMSGG